MSKEKAKKKKKKKLIQENLNAKVKIHNSHAKFIPLNRKKWRERNKKMQTYLDSIQIKGIREDGEDSARVEKFFWMILDGVWWECPLGSTSLYK